MSRAMKDSGVAWIGSVPEDWVCYKLKYLGKYINGFAFKPEDWSNTGRRIIRIQDLTGSNDSPNYFDGQIDGRYFVSDGDILVSWAATLEAFIWNKGEGWLNQHIFKVLPNTSIVEYDYFFWLIKEAMKNMNNDNKHGIMMQHVTLDVFGNFAVPIPPLPEQSRIAAFLDHRCAEIDRVIAATQRTIEEYKKLKQSIITEAVTHGVRGERKMKESGVEWIGEIPEEWTVTKTKSLADRIVVGVVIKPADHFSEDGTVPFLRGINVKEYIIIPEPMVYITNETNQMLSKSIVHTNDLLIVRDGSIGTTCVVPIEFDGSNVVSMIIVTCGNGISPQFVCYSFNSDVGKAQFNLTKIGSALTHTSVQSVSNILHVVPPFAEQMEIVKHLESRCAEIDRLIDAKLQLLTQMEAYKKSVIYEYVTGKKEVV